MQINTKENIEFLVDAIEDKEGFVWFSGAKGLYVYDGAQLINYANNSLEYPLKKDSSMESFGIMRKDAAGLLYIQERNYYNFICFDPLNRKVKYKFRTRYDLNKGLYFDMSISDKSDMMAAFFDQKRGKYHIRRVIDKKDSKEIYTGSFEADHFRSFQFGCGNHWLSNHKQILRVAADGGQVNEYHLPDDKEAILMTYVDEGHVFFLNLDCTRIYTWDKQTDKIVLYLSLPVLPLIQRLELFPLSQIPTKFAVRDGIVFLGNKHSFYIINKEDLTIQDLSELHNQYDQVNDISKGNHELIKIFFAGKDNIYLVKESEILTLKKKQVTENIFSAPIDKDLKVKNPVLSFRALAEDEQQNIYASYYNGLIVLKKGSTEFKPFPLFGSMPPNVLSTYSLNYWKGHLLWNNIMVDLKTGKHHFLGNWKKVEHTTQCLDKDTLWFYTWKSGQLFRYDLNQKTLKAYSVDKEVSSYGEPIEEINDMIPDQTGHNLWLATKWNGIALITKEGKLLKKYDWKQLKIEKGLGATVNKLHLSGEGLWFGCADGLGLLNTRTGEHVIYHDPYNDKGTLHNRNIFSILPDSLGNFYLGTNLGIVYFDTQTRQFYNLHEDHPLAKPECNRAAAFKASDGRYYFGTTNGLYSFVHSELPCYTPSPNTLKPIKICNITIFNSRHKEYHYLGVWNDPTKNLVLGHYDNTITLNVSVPEFDKTVYYSYRIKEQNEEWKEYSLDSRIYLYSLRSGDYTLEIKASTDLNDDTARFYKINIVVQQIWHKLIWVRLLFLLCTITIVVLLMRSRYRQKLQRQQDLANLRTKISMDLHDDVGSILAGLAIKSELLSYTTATENKQSLNDISSMGREAMETMRDIVWSMDNRKDKYENMIDRMKAFAEKSLQACGISHTFFLDGITGGHFIDPAKRQALYLIYKEALTNIIRHSDAKEVVIRLLRQKNMLCLSIHDNGIRPATAATAGMGLDNMKLRAQKIGAAFSAQYEQGGFLILLKIPY
ncbi:histidine kinase [Taibaiella sp. KBW10]|uniref:sensor histidine kinase n=1 Tax=Taibaiella sp. KBW10 TaxID=2153357 RepID=UPI0013155646|nr:histidine kinase [Taibaiella sp. KBW10]